MKSQASNPRQCGWTRDPSEDRGWREVGKPESERERDLAGYGAWQRRTGNWRRRERGGPCGRGRGRASACATAGGGSPWPPTAGSASRRPGRWVSAPAPPVRPPSSRAPARPPARPCRAATAAPERAPFHHHQQQQLQVFFIYQDLSQLA